MAKIYLLQDYKGSDGYYGDVIETISAHTTRELAEKAKLEKQAEMKAEMSDYITCKYGDWANYPQVWGNAKGAQEFVDKQGSGLQIFEVEVVD